MFAEIARRVLNNNNTDNYDNNVIELYTRARVVSVIFYGVRRSRVPRPVVIIASGLRRCICLASSVRDVGVPGVGCVIRDRRIWFRFFFPTVSIIGRGAIFSLASAELLINSPIRGPKAVQFLDVRGTCIPSSLDPRADADVSLVFRMRATENSRPRPVRERARREIKYGKRRPVYIYIYIYIFPAFVCPCMLRVNDVPRGREDYFPFLGV